jgi:hypothetical protein
MISVGVAANEARMQRIWDEAVRRSRAKKELERQQSRGTYEPINLHDHLARLSSQQPASFGGGVHAPEAPAAPEAHAEDG